MSNKIFYTNYETSIWSHIAKDSMGASLIVHEGRRFWYMIISIAGINASSEAVTDDYGNLVAVPGRC